MRNPLLRMAGAAALATTLMACGGSDDGGGASSDDCTSTSSVTVGALDSLKFDRDTYQTEAGCVGFTYRNEGSVAHTLLVRDEPGFKLAVGNTDTGSISLEPGTYELYCDVAGHGGMVADLTVS